MSYTLLTNIYNKLLVLFDVAIFQTSLFHADVFGYLLYIFVNVNVEILP